MIKKPILTKEQIGAKVDEFNSLPMEERHVGMKLGLDCEHVRDLIRESWDFAKKTAENEGKTDIDCIAGTYFISITKTIAQSMGAPEYVVDVLAHKLMESSIFKGMLWHAFSEVVPEEDLVLLTGTFDVYSEVSDD